MEFDATDEISAELTNSAGTHIAVTSDNVEMFYLDTLEGDDLIRVDAEDLGRLFVIGGGNSSGSDVLQLLGDPNTEEDVTIAPNVLVNDNQDITGFINQIDVIGIEQIEFEGQSAIGDSLTVNLGDGDNTARVERGSAISDEDADLVTSDSLPRIQFTGLEEFTVGGGSGSDVVTFVTRNLVGAINTNYNATLDGTDTLVIEGADGAADDYTVTQPLGVLQVTDSSSGVTVTETSNTLGRLQINTLGGDDRVEVNATNGLIAPLVTYDGGSGSDSLRVAGSETVAQTEYMPGPDVLEGRLAYSMTPGDQQQGIDPSREMIIDFVNLEPIYDTLPSTVAVTVYGTNADNAINFSEGPHGNTGLVSVDGFETYEFDNKGDVLEIIGLAGDDVINLDYQGTALPVGLDRIWVEGNDPTASDHVIVNGTTGPGADTFDVEPTGADSASILYTNTTFAVVPMPIEVRTAELITFNGQGDDDHLIVDTASGTQTVTVTPGATVDSGNVRVDSLVPIDFVNMGASGTLIIDDPDVSAVEELVYMGTAGTDTFLVDSIETIKLNNQIDVITDDIEEYTFKGLGGDDTFDIDGLAATALTRINVEGDEPGSGSDTLDYTSLGATIVDFEVTLGLETGLTTITDAGAPIVVFSGSRRSMSMRATRLWR